jgi:hypothetical protein
MAGGATDLFDRGVVVLAEASEWAVEVNVGGVNEGKQGSFELRI